MRLQDMQQLAVPGSYRQLHDALREHPTVRGLSELDRASQDAMDLPQPGVPRVRKSHARRGEVVVRRPIQRSNASFAVPAYRARCSRASATVVESRGKVEKNTSVSQIYLRRDVQPEERIVRLGSSEL